MTDQDDEEPTSRSTLGENILRLMRARPKLSSNPKLSEKSGIAVSTISRLINGKTAATLDNVARLARAFDLEPWQLLVPDLDPTNPQILRASSKEEDELYKRLKEVIAKEAAVQAQGSDSGFQPLPDAPRGPASWKKITPIPDSPSYETERHKKER